MNVMKSCYTASEVLASPLLNPKLEALLASRITTEAHWQTVWQYACHDQRELAEHPQWDSHPPNDYPLWWRRETLRMISGFYRPLPKHLAPLFPADQFVHESRHDRCLVAYTPDDERYRHEDRQIRCRIGRLAHRLGLADVPDIGRTYLSQRFVLRFLTDADDLAEAFIDGPRTCMSDEVCSDGELHPSRVYAGPDTVVAVLIGERHRYEARAVVNIQTGQFNTCYGDYADELRQRLRANGYEHSKDFLNGARLLLIHDEFDDEKRVMMPFLDTEDQRVYAFEPLSRSWCVIGGEADAPHRGEFLGVAHSTHGYLS